MMNSENYEININHQDAVFEHLENRFNKLAELINTKSISYALILQEIEAVQTIVHAANEIKSNSERVNSIITKFNGANPVTEGTEAKKFHLP
ncbi:MAG: hypothetical protein OXM61_00595 [Candidatus Poribacteria bacterium]|nr:hypothetical protein [Candidatus Poribacteria bacterium]